MPLTRENSSSIHIELVGITEAQGLTIINRFLSALCWKTESSVINHYGFAGSSIPIPILRQKTPSIFNPALDFPSELFEIKEEKAKLAVALYREGMGSDSTLNKFLSFFKILNIFFPDRKDKGVNKLVEGLRDILPYVNDTECKKRMQKISQQFGDVADYLYEYGRCAVAHVYHEPLVDPDDVLHLRVLSEDAYLMECIVTYLIKKEFELEQSIWA